ncbi:Glutamate-1-semialdehyde 2,1-aminomutase [bacterium HR10]|uniref:Glutamate-1-semialdehyde 2,1-aminomutase n=1 Tax=uncultured Acidobacteriota bacterium TaxID=171953 RepID=H5SCG4_9BACT|nr:aminotransferase class III [uncultured Acidobacteriota bacterium]GBC83152.1 Glutamate-1-semialdehyde 2,1-aminomutase [bacterium HR10]
MNYARSIAFFERARQVVAGGVNSNVRAASRPVPLFYREGRGARLVDVDGNEYIDYCLGQGPLLLGHSHPRVLDAVQRQLEQGQLYAGQHELEILVAEKLRQHIPCAELVRFSNSGSEAVHIALRVARAFTGRTKIIKFEGHYHGWFDNILVSVNPETLDHQPVRESRGQTESVLDEVIVLPWNDASRLQEVLATSAPDIAAVIMEPIMCNTGCILPESGYLEAVRDLCTRYGVLLIFDEIITGFRLGLGGAQAFFGVTPDLATFGKALGSGFPVSCLAGKREIMEQISTLSVVHAGTYNANPVSLAAAWATLQELEQNREMHYQNLFTLGQTLMRGIAEIAERKGRRVVIQGLGPMFHVAFTTRPRIRDARDYRDVETVEYAAFAYRLQERGVRIIPRGIWYLSTAHTEDDIAQTLESVAAAL